MSMTELCKRCKEPAVVISRQEAFCKSCFIRFVQHRQKKQLEKFKVDYSTGKNVQEQHILLPLSLGKGSIALLDMAVELIRLQKQTHRGRQGFNLHAVYIDLNIEDHLNGLHDKNDDNGSRILDMLREAYPECEISTVSITEFMADSKDNVNLLLDRNNTEEDKKYTVEPLDFLRHMSRTARQDSIDIMKEQLITRIASKKRCQTVIYGHSQTRLAELVVALTAKGRGNMIPKTLESNIYPLRDILSSEIVIYNQMRELDKYIKPEARIPETTKLQSIDELVGKYFASVEQGFPSVVSTVVRTGDKLGDSSSSESVECMVCSGHADPDMLRWIDKITVNGPELPPASGLCYGCTVMFRNSVSQISWPRNTKQEVLDNYLLD